MSESDANNGFDPTPTFSLFKRALQYCVVLVVVLAAFTGTYSYYDSYEEVSDFQKEHLKNIALLILNQHGKDNNNQLFHHHYHTEEKDGGLLIDVMTATEEFDENDNKVPVKSHEQDLTALNPTQISMIPEGLSHQRIGDDMWQIYRLDDDNQTIVVRQSSDLQDELAKQAAWQAVLPVLIAMLVFSILLVWIMWKLFLPIRALSSQVRSRHSHDLKPLYTKNLPKELAPFVKSINQLLEHVTADIARQERFIADVSHELRSPLTAISLQLQRLQKLPSDNQMQQGLEKLNSRVKQNQDLIEQLLTLARINQAPFSEQKVVLRPIIEQSIQLLLPLIDSKNLNMSLDINSKLASFCVNADETVLLILIKNLLQNAILYTPEKGNIAITLVNIHDWETSLKNHAVQITGIESIKNLPQDAKVLQIIDSGMGINPENYLKAFDPFVRFTKQQSERSDSVKQFSHQNNGTGLGLALVKSICLKLGIQLYLSPSQHSKYNVSSNRGLCVSLVFES